MALVINSNTLTNRTPGHLVLKGGCGSYRIDRGTSLIIYDEFVVQRLTVDPVTWLAEPEFRLSEGFQYIVKVTTRGLEFTGEDGTHALFSKRESVTIL